jgi:hypothetical protein
MEWIRWGNWLRRKVGQIRIATTANQVHEVEWFELDARNRCGTTHHSLSFHPNNRKGQHLVIPASLGSCRKKQSHGTNKWMIDPYRVILVIDSSWNTREPFHLNTGSPFSGRRNPRNGFLSFETWLFKGL